jgi:hypothetical protein
MLLISSSVSLFKKQTHAIEAQWESRELEDVDDERRQILEEAAELDHIWGVWEGEKELTNVPREGLGNHPKVETT